MRVATDRKRVQLHKLLFLLWNLDALIECRRLVFSTRCSASTVPEIAASRKHGHNSRNLPALLKVRTNVQQFMASYT